ncbi:hypothetical protein ES708_08425 [subsurface metagenome]
MLLCLKVMEHRSALVNEEVRKSLTVKMKPSIVKKARVGAVISEKTLGEWLEEAIDEKAEREQKKVK